MNQQIRQILEKITGMWKKLEQRQRRNLLIVAGIFVLTVALLSWFALRPKYTIIFANQSAASLGAIAQKLDDLKIPHQEDATSLSVPEQYQNDARMKLAMAGLPNSGPAGYSVFDQNTLGMTDGEFNVRYKQALEGNIEGAIDTLQGVQEAKVNLVLPDKKLFVDQNTQDAKASVVVMLQPGAKLSTDQVAGIQQLVSHSVEGLTPQNVSIVDQNGVRLVDDQGVALGDGVSTQLSKQQQIQNQVEMQARNNIRNALERLVGLGNVDVVVHASLDFDQKKWTDKKLTPVVGNNGAVISEQNINKQSDGTQPADVPGNNGGNNGNGGTYKSQNGTSSSSDKESTINRDWNTYTETGETAPFAVKSYTVSVLLNDPKLSNARIQQVKQFVATAIGQNNDGSADTQITVTGGQFQAPADPFANTNAFYKQPWFFGAMAAALVLLGGGLYFASRRRKQADQPVVEERPVEAPIVVEETENQRMKKQLEKLASQKPEEFVNLLRTWLVEE